jgi:hypothetical protein
MRYIVGPKLYELVLTPEACNSRAGPRSADAALTGTTPPWTRFGLDPRTEKPRCNDQNSSSGEPQAQFDGSIWRLLVMSRARGRSGRKQLASKSRQSGLSSGSEDAG